jgi:hypothetical protein
LSHDGQRYDRLTGAALVQAIRGRTFCPSRACSGIDGTVDVFQPDGVYLVFGDRWDDGGRYTIVNDMVIVKTSTSSSRYAFYRSNDGTVRRAWERRGKIESSRVFTE